MYTIIIRYKLDASAYTRSLVYGEDGKPGIFDSEAAARGRARMLESWACCLPFAANYTVHRVDRLARRFREEIAKAA
jgi:hypothetical protein